MNGRKIVRVGTKYVLRIIESFFAFVFFYLTIALYGEAISVGELKSKGEYYVYVQSNGVHTDICFPVHSKVIHWDKFVNTQPYEMEEGADFIAIGWGDKGFFLHTPEWSQLKTSTALNAAFLPSETAMHVDYKPEPKEDKDHRKVYMSKKEYKRLVRFVKKSFKKKNHRVDLIPHKGYTKHDNFYEANRSYHLFRTCNVWTNQALKEANVKTGVFAVFPYGIMGNLK